MNFKGEWYFDEIGERYKWGYLENVDSYFSPFERMENYWCSGDGRTLQYDWCFSLICKI